MSTKIFVDTNILKNDSSKNNYLGHRDELDALAKHGDLMLPKVVIDELEIQKIKSLKADRSSFVSNQFFKHAGIDKTLVDAVNDVTIVTALRDDEEIQYTIIDLSNQNVLSEVYELAINKYPPFKHDTDEGFKDALVYLTVKQYKQNNPTDDICVITNDKRLTEAFKRISIEVYTDAKSYINSGPAYFRDEYFLSRIKEDTHDGGIVLKDMKRLNGQEVEVMFGSETSSYRVVADVASKEPISVELLYS